MSKLFFSLLLTLFSIHCSNCAVLELTDKTFDKSLNELKKAIVMFYSPGCGHCQRLKPTYEQLADRSEVKELGVAVARVDCSDAGKEKCGKYNVRGYPTVKLLSRADQNSEFQVEYEGNRTIEDLILFVREGVLPVVRELSDEEALDFVNAHTQQVVLGFFKDRNSALFEQLKKHATDHRKAYKFGFTFSQSVADKLGQKMESFVIYRQKHLRSKLEDASLVFTSVSGVSDFLKNSRYSIVDFRSPRNQKDFDNEKIVVVYVGFDPVLKASRTKRLRSSLIRLAQTHNKVRFLFSKRDDYLDFINGFALNAPDNDIYVVAYNSAEDKYVLSEALHDEDIKTFESAVSKFVTSFLNGELPQYTKSEPVPKQSGPVVVVVGKTFGSIVLDDTKDVLIEMYAPWCGHCKKLEPIYTKLAETLAGEEHLVIAKMDATANDGSKNFPVEGFPTIYLAKAGAKNKPVKYNGERTVEAMAKWLKSHTTHPLKYEVPTKKDKKEL